MPDISEMLFFGTLYSSDNKSITAKLALPSLAGALTLTFNISPTKPAILFCEAPAHHVAPVPIPEFLHLLFPVAWPTSAPFTLQMKLC